eukprot:RCo027162
MRMCCIKRESIGVPPTPPPFRSTFSLARKFCNSLAHLSRFPPHSILCSLVVAPAQSSFFQALPISSPASQKASAVLLGAIPTELTCLIAHEKTPRGENFGRWEPKPAVALCDIPGCVPLRASRLLPPFLRVNHHRGSQRNAY